jgi:Fuc2NAc and GlcNAc transferase
MSLAQLLCVPAAAAVASWWLTGAVRGYALRQAMLDVPNGRSSHSVPTPRGGGLAIAVVVLGGIALLAGAGLVPRGLAAGLLGGGVLLAAVGWLDDRGHVFPGWRALAQFAAAAWMVAWAGGFPSVDLGAGRLTLGLAGAVVAVVGTVWWINLYNFMDGVDGIAGGQAVLVAGTGAALLLARGQAGLGLVALLVAGAAAGFLRWNWQPARIFMGDVGSGLLGFLFAGLAVGSERAQALPVAAWVLLSACFVFDATLTLARRVARGERWYDGHRSHAYQRAVQAGLSHARVTTGVLVLSGVMAGLAAAAAARPTLLPAALGAAVLLLGAVALVVERMHPVGARSAATAAAAPAPSEAAASVPKAAMHPRRRRRKLQLPLPSGVGRSLDPDLQGRRR